MRDLRGPPGPAGSQRNQQGLGFAPGPRDGPRDGPRPLDRSVACPLLLRTFIKKGEHHKVEDFASRAEEPVADEVQLHAWMNMTLRELSELIKQVYPSARDKQSRLSFSIVYPDKRGVLTLKDVGSTHALRRGPEDDKTLAELHFQAGDYMDVALIPPIPPMAPS